jgi:aspartyl-tRNA(Asn)/glutamyl-tRNA(Gln) amidotransferase subunit A
MKIGYAPVDFTERADAAARPAFQAALDVLRQAGAQLVETRLPAFPYGQALSTILAAEQASIFESLIASGKVEELADKAQIAGLKASLETPAKDYLKAMRIRRAMQRAFAELFATVDALIAPGRTGPASKIEQPLTPFPGSAAPPSAAPADPGFAAITPAGNLAGLPALVLPCGFAANLPIALQLVGAPFSENLLLGIGREFQARTDWHKRRPPE